jgi:hypothetical protein
MATFPLLSTGAVAQYPLSRGTSYDVDIVRFLDGSEQRCLVRDKKLRRWLVSLAQLNESELASVEQFFEEAQGNAQLFTFIDPLTSAAVPNCRISNRSITTQYKALGSGSASVWIEETNG